MDNGTEFLVYAKLALRFPVKVYFATPYHSWERGSNENFNGLNCQYPPKGMCMRSVTQAQCDQTSEDLNNRPRKRHGFKTPADLYHRIDQCCTCALNLSPSAWTAQKGFRFVLGM